MKKQKFGSKSSDHWDHTAHTHIQRHAQEDCDCCQTAEKISHTRQLELQLSRRTVRFLATESSFGCGKDGTVSAFGARTREEKKYNSESLFKANTEECSFFSWFSWVGKKATTTRKYAKYTLAVRPLGFPRHHPSSEVEKRWCVCKETVSSLGGKVLRW